MGDEADVPATSCRSRTGFLHSRSHSRAVARECKNNPFRYMPTQLFWERQLWSGNESVEIRYVNGSFVAGTSPGVPRQYPPGSAPHAHL